MSSRRVVSGVALGAIVSSLFVFGGGCLTRPVVAGNPVTKTNFTVGYSTTSINKIDILFDIDNSSSMGDKQSYLAQAVPDLITRLVQPNCIDANGNAILGDGGTALIADSAGNCSEGQPEFSAVHDMHIGVLSSSLGPRGTQGKAMGNGTICQISTTANATPGDYNEYTSGTYQQFLLDYASGNFGTLSNIPKNDDDEGHLVTRTDPVTSPNAPTTPLNGGNFLAWSPTGAASPGGVVVTNPTTLATDFQDLVVGSQAYGCGIESQLESWYRFLIQPDPYLTITAGPQAGCTSNCLLQASWSGLDTTILQQRAEFLRPDSLVLIVVLSDENDSEVDVRTINGLGVNWLDSEFQPPLPTTACASGNPGASNCQSCAFVNSVTKADSNCQMSPDVYPSDNTNFGFNDNVRHVHMKQKYGVDLQFPINRYVLGLTSPKVPNRNGEYPTSGPNSTGYYQGGLNSDPSDLNCVNPLFAQNLPSPTTQLQPDDPTICSLTPSTTRSPANNLVYYAHIGGVPHELLTTTTNGVITPKETLAAADWTLILGNNPQTYDYNGIDPHMIESYQPRTGLPLNTAGPPVGNSDESGDWFTDGETPSRVNLPIDREYACVFKLSTPRDCDPGTAAAPSNQSEADISSCDCSTAGLAADHVPAVCNASNPLQQDYAKAYPTIRELLLANLLKTQGIVSSLCPIDIEDNAQGNDPLYGYRPAVATIIDRLKASLTSTCLPETLQENDAGAVPCLVLATLPGVTGTDACNDATNTSLQPVNPTILQEFQADQHAAYVAGTSATDLSLDTTCQINQVLPAQFLGNTCKNNNSPTKMGTEGWCYITGTGTCPQSIDFSVNGLPKGGIISLQCLENSSDFASGNGTGGGSSTPVSTASSDAAASGD